MKCRLDSFMQRNIATAQKWLDVETASNYVSIPDSLFRQTTNLEMIVTFKLQENEIGCVEGGGRWAWQRNL